MLKQSITAILLLLSVTTNLVNAQNVQSFSIEVPFQFLLKGKTLPAGKYTIERTDPGRPNLLTVKKADGNIIRVVLTQRAEKDQPSTAASLVFIRRAGKHYLFQVWNPGAMNGNQIPFPFDTKGDQHRSNVTFITLKARH